MGRLLPLLALVITANHAFADTQYWVTAGDGSYVDPANWTAAVPTAYTDVIFDQDIAYTVTRPPTHTEHVRTLTVSAGDVTLDLNYPGWITGYPQYFGKDGGNGLFTLSDGAEFGGVIYAGTDPGSVGTVIIEVVA